MPIGEDKQEQGLRQQRSGICGCEWECALPEVYWPLHEA